MKISKENKINIIKVVVFLLIIFQGYKFCTYLFRNTDYIQRRAILDYYDEDKNSLDVVFVGASGLYRYIDPMYLWGEYGIASSNYAVASMPAPTMMAAIEDSLRTQSPDVLVIDARRYERNITKGEVTAGARNLIDSFDIGFRRLKAVYDYCKIAEMSWKDSIPFYIDLILYHFQRNNLEYQKICSRKS